LSLRLRDLRFDLRLPPAAVGAAAGAPLKKIVKGLRFITTPSLSLLTVRFALLSAYNCFTRLNRFLFLSAELNTPVVVVSGMVGHPSTSGAVSVPYPTPNVVNTSV